MLAVHRQVATQAAMEAFVAARPAPTTPPMPSSTKWLESQPPAVDATSKPASAAQDWMGISDLKAPAIQCVVVAVGVPPPPPPPGGWSGKAWQPPARTSGSQALQPATPPPPRGVPLKVVKDSMGQNQGNGHQGLLG